MVLKHVLLLAFAASMIAIALTDYTEYGLYSLETKDGKPLKVFCPKIPRDTDTLTYFYSKDCLVIK